MSACELCTSHHPNEIWRNHFIYIIDAKDPVLPGYLRVVLCRHVAEMSDLTDQERHTLMDVVNLIEKAMRDIMSPKKINLAQFGTMVPHVHWHIIARYEDDAFYPASTWSAKVRATEESVLKSRRALADQLNTRVVELLNRAFP